MISKIIHPQVSITIKFCQDPGGDFSLLRRAARRAELAQLACPQGFAAMEKKRKKFPFPAGIVARRGRRTGTARVELPRNFRSSNDLGIPFGGNASNGPLSRLSPATGWERVRVRADSEKA
jgi:hypothetical protein